jgi:tellurite resistance protein TehA-like permease
MKIYWIAIIAGVIILAWFIYAIWTAPTIEDKNMEN